MVAAHFGQHGAWNASSSERHNAVEGRAARYGFLWLIVLEQDIQHGLAYAYYAFWGHAIHVFFFRMAAKIQKNAVFYCGLMIIVFQDYFVFLASESTSKTKRIINI
jgi:hypothetical protein